MKAYLAGSAELLAQWQAVGEVRAERGFAVTDLLRSEFESADDDDLEYHVLAEAGEASLRLQANGSQPVARRLVVVCEASDAVLRPLLDEPATGAVEVVGALAWQQVESLHLDDADAEPVIAAAAAALRQPDRDHAAVEAGLDAVSGFELMWFDVTEAEAVRGMLRPSGEACHTQERHPGH